VIVVKKAAEHRRTPKALHAKLSMTDFRFAKLATGRVRPMADFWSATRHRVAFSQSRGGNRHIDYSPITSHHSLAKAFGVHLFLTARV
jgi:hypothetical protein